MKKYVLPPRAALANNILMTILGLSAVLNLAFLDSKAMAVLIAGYSGLIIVGAALKHPLTYNVLIGMSFFGLTIALNKMLLPDILCILLNMTLAFYIRSNIYVRVESPASAEADQA